MDQEASYRNSFSMTKYVQVTEACTGWADSNTNPPPLLMSLEICSFFLKVCFFSEFLLILLGFLFLQIPPPP